MRVLVALDKFKDCMSAAEACEIATATLKSIKPDWELETVPLTDGGEGFAGILTAAVGGELESLPVQDALGRERKASLGWVPLSHLNEGAREDLALPPDTKGRIALIEMAQASGLEALSESERNPWNASSFGTGQLIQHAAAQGAAAIVLGIGGSATNDCGVGALEAMGLVAYGHDFQPVRDLSPGRWTSIASLGGLYNLRDRFPPLRIACDVSNPLLGERGATAVYGPQKGLQPEDFERMERAMGKMAARLLGLAGFSVATFEARKNEPGSGAAGGIGFGLRTLLPDVQFVPGFNLVSAWLGLAEKAHCADIIITGEGKFDASSLEGKAPSTLLTHASDEAKVYVFAGRIDLPETALRKKLAASTLTEITSPGTDPATALRTGPQNLRMAIQTCFAS